MKQRILSLLFEKGIFLFLACTLLSQASTAKKPLLTPPTLSAPANGAIVNVNVELKWNAVPGALSYNVQVSTDPDFNAIWTYWDLTTTSFVFPLLYSQQQYYWRVSAKDVSYVNSEWSAPRSFTTAAPSFRFGDPLVPRLDLSSTSTIVAGDLSGKGHNELLFYAQHRGTRDIYNVFRLQKEAGAWVLDSLYIRTTVPSGAAPIPADMDNDGDLDLVTTEERVLWNENGVFQRPTTTNSSANVSTRVFDRGNNGTLDVAFGIWPYFMQNLGQRQFAEKNYTYMPGVSRSLPDLNKDGRMDWVVSDGAAYYHHSSKDTFQGGQGLVSISTNYALITHAIGDIDRNGWVDLATIHTSYLGPRLSLHYFGATGRIRVVQDFAVESVKILDLADLNNDGWLDLLFMNNNALKVCWNKAGELDLAANSHPLYSWHSAYIEPAIADLDGDLDLDIAFVDREGYLRILENTTAFANTAPAPPVMQRASFLADTLRFKWRPGTDSQQPSASLAYNLRVGTTYMGGQILSAASDSLTGYHYNFRYPNASQDTLWMLKEVQPGIYYYSAQAMDHSRVASPFSNIDTLYVCAPVKAELPSNGLKAADTSLLFQWTSGFLAQRYQLQVSTDSLFKTLAKDITVTDTAVMVRNLPDNTDLYWRVRSVNDDGASAWTLYRALDTRRLSIELNWDPTKTLCLAYMTRGMGVTVHHKGSWNSGNQFIVELSDFYGSFNSPRTLKTVTDSIAPDVIRFSLQGVLTTPDGLDYKLRVRSTAPAQVSQPSATFSLKASTYHVGFNYPFDPVCKGDTVLQYLMIPSDGADSVVWYRNEQRIGVQYPWYRPLKFSESGVYKIEGYGWNCLSVDTIRYVAKDCYKVWPGDTNSDSVVNESDLFTLGKYYGKTGTARSTSSIEWQGFDAPEWTDAIQTNYYNLKHVDANGDGSINQTDTLAIATNYNRTHTLGRWAHQSKKRSPTSDIVRLTFDKAAYAPNEWVEGSIVVGTSSRPVLFSGVAFNLVIPDSVMVPGTLSVETASTGLFAQQGASVRLFKNNRWIQHTATGKNIKGYGTIVRFRFQMRALNTGSAIQAAVDKIVFTNLNSDEWTAHEQPPAVMTVTSATRLEELLPSGTAITIAPNPIANGSLQWIAEMPHRTVTYIKLYSAGGLLMAQKEIILPAGRSVQKWSPLNWTAGIYYIEIETKGWATVRKVVVQ